MKKAWIENDIVRDICQGDPAECYHPDIAVFYNTDVPEEALPGATLVGGEWVNPVIPEATLAEPVQPDMTVSPVEFKLLWTPQERVAIKTLKSTDPVIEDFYELIEDPRLKEVNLSLQSTQQAVDYLLFKLVEAGTITESQVADRREAILSGKFQ